MQDISVEKHVHNVHEVHEGSGTKDSRHEHCIEDVHANVQDVHAAPVVTNPFLMEDEDDEA